MRTLVVYDSCYGNTEKVAKTIGKAIKGKVALVDNVSPSNLSPLDLLIVGSPVQGGIPTPAISEFLKKIPQKTLNGVKITAFDTRIAAKDHRFGIRLLLHILKYAAPRIAKKLTQKGGILITQPEGFIVKAKEGPLKEGELERSIFWARKAYHDTENSMKRAS